MAKLLLSDQACFNMAQLVFYTYFFGTLCQDIYTSRDWQTRTDKQIKCRKDMQNFVSVQKKIYIYIAWKQNISLTLQLWFRLNHDRLDIQRVVCNDIPVWPADKLQSNWCTHYLALIYKPFKDPRLQSWPLSLSTNISVINGFSSSYTRLIVCLLFGCHNI